jgi:hypothetical protein
MPRLRLGISTATPISARARTGQQVRTSPLRTERDDEREAVAHDRRLRS